MRRFLIALTAATLIAGTVPVSRANASYTVIKVVSATGDSGRFVTFAQNYWKLRYCLHTDRRSYSYLQVKQDGYWYSIPAKKSFTYDAYSEGLGCSPHFMNLFEISRHESSPGVKHYRLGYPGEYGGSYFDYFTITVKRVTLR